MHDGKRPVDPADLARRAGASPGWDTPNPAAPSTGSGGYRFSPDELRTVLAMWQQLSDGLAADRAIAVEAARRNVAPADEPASRRVGAKNWNTWQEFLRHNESMKKFVDAYIDTLSRVSGAYVRRDEDAAHDVARASGRAS